MENSKCISKPEIKTVKVNSDSKASFYNNVDFCVGTGRFGLALTKEYLDELKFVQEEIGFKHIRGHGLFSDDTAIYHEYEENGEVYGYTFVEYEIFRFLFLQFVLFSFFFLAQATSTLL